ncbi:hypothetical protein HZS_2986 [Henneguya salminicola]|nr:hypothetical protein HZS_2986 [Henneguya salminicola]
MENIGVKYLIHVGMLKDRNGSCLKCGIGIFSLHKKGNQPTDTYAWRCSIDKCRHYVSIRKGNIFCLNFKFMVFEIQTRAPNNYGAHVFLGYERPYSQANP